MEQPQAEKTFLTRYHHEIDRKCWDDFVQSSSYGHIMQTSAWGEFKANLGWLTERIAIEHNGALIAGAQMLIQPLPLLPYTIAYIPKGPLLNLSNKQASKPLFSALHQIAQKHKAIFLKIEPGFLDDSKIHQQLLEHGFRASQQTNQPRSTLIVDLRPGPEAILSGMRKKTRQLIHRAEREGVEIIEGGVEDIDAFYRILIDTSEHKSFSIHEKKYYAQAWQTFHQIDGVKLFLARYASEIVAGKMVFTYKDRSMHFWGGASQTGRKVFASYLIQWKALQWASDQGYKYADLWGIPDSIGQYIKTNNSMPPDTKDPLWGVYKFKKGFRGEIEFYVGGYDYVYHQLLYTLGTNILTRFYTQDAIAQIIRKL